MTNLENSTTPDAPMSAERDRATDLWRSGQRHEAITVAFASERAQMYQIARGVVGTDTAADIAQEAVMRLWSHPERFDPERGTLGSYLRLTTRYTALDHLRSKVARQRREIRSLSTDESVAPDASHEVLDMDIRRRVVVALARIPAEESTLITQAFFGRVDYQTLAAHHGLAEGTVKYRIRRGMRRLRQELALDAPAVRTDPVLA